MTYACPVCGYPSLYDEPRYEGGGSYEICPSCGFEFGVSDDDRGYSYEAWRDRWVAGGMAWRHPDEDGPPKDWDPRVQLRRLLDNAGRPSMVVDGVSVILTIESSPYASAVSSLAAQVRALASVAPVRLSQFRQLRAAADSAEGLDDPRDVAGGALRQLLDGSTYRLSWRRPADPDHDVPARIDDVNEDSWQDSADQPYLALVRNEVKRT